jgi:hypothetical protein
VFVAGASGGGKSVLLNHMATRFRCQRLLLDTKDEWNVPGITPAHTVAGIDWIQPVIHLIVDVDGGGDSTEISRLFRVAWHRKVGRAQGKAYGLVIIVHELGDICDDTPARTPTSFVNYVKKGDAHGLGLLAGTQRPVNVPKIARTQSEHVISMGLGFDTEDIPTMAGVHDLTVPEYERALAQAHAISPHAYIYRNRITRTNIIRPPLPEQYLRRTLAVNIAATRKAPEPLTTPEPPERSGAGSGTGTFRSGTPERSGVHSGTSTTA